MMERPAHLWRVVECSSGAEWFGVSLREVRDRDVICWRACRIAADRIMKRIAKLR
jgi:hypothetical protein